MVNRLVKPLKNHSFFMFGARGTGKTYFLERFLNQDTTFTLDLLKPDNESAFLLNPGELADRIEGLPEGISHIFIDEIQKVPKLLDVVHHYIEKSELKFVLTGSSARKLKRGGANLLAGRAFVYDLFPLTARELGERFDIKSTLEWGALPKLISLPEREERELYLRTYVNTYLKEEIAEEQIVRKLEPFRRFLQVAAQSSGEIINFSKIGRDVGVSTQTVQSYFQILEDTLLGRFIHPFHESIRKRQRENPKFYLFDTGVKRALDRTLTVPLLPQTYAYGVAFEHFIVNEIHRQQSYAGLDYELSYLRTHDDAEIDLILERPGLPRALIEIKSTVQVTRDHLRHVAQFAKDISNSESFCLSRDPHAKKIDGVHCLHWERGLEELGLYRNH